MRSAKKTGLGLILILLMGGIIASCMVNDLANGNGTLEWSTASGTPYASVEELDAVTNLGSEYVYWRVARVFSVLEMESFKNEEDWYNTQLSGTPVVIYDSMSCPKYYEFRVIHNGEEIGAVTATAKKEGSSVVNFVLDSVKDYSHLKKKGDNYQVIAEDYPSSVVYGIVTKSGEKISSAIDPDSGEDVEIYEPMGLLEFLNTADQDTLIYMGITNQCQIEILIEYVISNSNDSSRMWASIDEYESNIIALTDEEIIEMMRNDSTKGSYSHPLILSTWEAISGITRGGHCSISALWWIYRGLYDKYRHNTFSTTSSSGMGEDLLYNDLYDKMGIDKGGNLYPRFESAMEFVTGFKYKIAFDYWYGTLHHWDHAWDKIANTGLPLISTRYPGKIKADGTKSEAEHARVVYGVRHDHKEWSEWVTFLWSGWWTTKTSDTYYYRMHDNGADNGGVDWWEADNESYQKVLLFTEKI